MDKVKKFSLPEFGYEVQLGKFAQQADGAVWMQHGGTVVLATVVAAASKDEFPGFLPLSVDYREMFSAAGKIPGGYFKREGKMTDKEVLTSRLIDRAVRPLFPDKFFDQVQLLATVYSVDKEHIPSVPALVASSLALTISKIPFLEPVGAVEIGRIDGQLVVNPTYPQTKLSDLRLIVAGTVDGVCMLEGSTGNISEEELMQMLDLAQSKIKLQIDWQNQIARELQVAKETSTDIFDWAAWEEIAKQFFTKERLASICNLGKKACSEAITGLFDQFMVQHADQIGEDDLTKKKVMYALDTQFKQSFTDYILTIGKRVDGRDFETVRPVSTEVGLLPFTHGSALFMRGNTQALVSTTLGTGQDAQKIEEIMDGVTDQKFILHYNFPSFSVGEVRPSRGPGRREVGHGALAASAIRPVLPDADKFPYTIRIVSDILECFGSSSMATVCGSTMALMDAGVPIKAMVSGVAMGLLKDSTGSKFQPITDINGFEDAFGWMDFKVAGTDQGITAIQLDIKNKGGLTKEVFVQALAQAKAGRKVIMDRMKATLSQPRAELSELVPKMVSFKIEQDRIGAVIGSGGKIIREIIEKTNVTIDIEDDGTVNIFGTPGAGLEKAISWVKTLAGKIETNAVYEGKVRRITDFGIFVELVPGLDGLLHISNIPRADQANIEKLYPTNSDLKVIVLNYDADTGRIKLGFADKDKQNKGA